jgi:hypothetical protein
MNSDFSSRQRSSCTKLNVLSAGSSEESMRRFRQGGGGRSVLEHVLAGVQDKFDDAASFLLAGSLGLTRKLLSDEDSRDAAAHYHGPLGSGILPASAARREAGTSANFELVGFMDVEINRGLYN